MVDWQCPKCDGKMYSAYNQREKKYVKCIYCEEVFENKYYKVDKLKI
jgi:hypothetical protein